MDLSLTDGAGLVGVALIAMAYLLLQMGRTSTEMPAYSAANGLGAALVLWSLTADFNLSAALIEGFWLLVSLYGFVRSVRTRAANRTQRNPDDPVQR